MQAADRRDQFTDLRFYGFILQVQMVWGLKGMDTSGKRLWDGTDKGQLAYDDGFDPSSAEAQLFLLQARRLHPPDGPGGLRAPSSRRLCKQHASDM